MPKWRTAPFPLRFKDMESVLRFYHLIAREGIIYGSVPATETVEGVVRESKEYKEAPYELRVFTR